MNMMKVVTYVLGALLAAAVAAAALFYFMTFRPLATDYARMKAGQPALDKAKAELKKYKDKEAKDANETAWIAPLLDDLAKGLAPEIQSGKAEAAMAGNSIVLNISEDLLYTPHSVTFAATSRPLLEKIAGLLANRNLKGREIVIANTTDAVPAQGRGRKKIPPRDARTISTERSLALTKFLAQKVDEEALIAAGYNKKPHDSGFKIKDHKTMIVIQNPPAPAAKMPATAKAAEKTEAAPAAGVQPAPAAAIPLKPAPNAQ